MTNATAERFALENRQIFASDDALRADYPGVVIVWDKLRGRSAHGPSPLYYEAWGTVIADGRQFRVIVAECSGDDIEAGELRRIHEDSRVGALVPAGQRGELRAAAVHAYRAMRAEQRKQAREAERARAEAAALAADTPANRAHNAAAAELAAKPAPAYRLEFFSGSEALGNDTGAHGYDGSMSVAAFDPADLPAHIRRMDCVCGPVLVVVTSPEGFKSAWPCVREP